MSEGYAEACERKREEDAALRRSLADDAGAFRHLIAPPEFSTPPTPTMLDAYREEIATFLRSGGTISLRDWCLMPHELRDAAILARARVAEEAGARAARDALDRMEAAVS